MKRLTGIFVFCIGACSFWVASCTGLGESDCSRDDDCGINETCVVGLCTPRADGGDAETDGDEALSSATGSRADTAGDATDQGHPGADTDSRDSDVDGGSPTGDGGADNGDGDAGADADADADGTPVGSGEADGDGDANDGDGDGNGSDSGDPNGSEEPVDPCGDEPTADVACLIPAGEDGSGDTTICAAFRPFCGEDVVPAPGQAFAQCTEESLERSLEHLDESMLAPVFLDERSCDGQDNNCDGRVDEQCCRVQGLRPKPVVLPSECVGAFSPEGPDQHTAAEEFDAAQRMLLDVRTVGPENELALTWLSLVFTPGSGVGTIRLLRDRVDGRTGVATEREVWIDEGEDAFAYAMLPPTSTGALFIGVTRQGELGAVRVDMEAESLLPVTLTVEGFDSLEVKELIPFTHTTNEGEDRLFFALLVVTEGTVDEPVEQRWELVEADLDETMLSIEGAQRLPLVFPGTAETEHLPRVSGDSWFPFSLFTSADGDMYARWCWQDIDREREEVTCYSVVDPLGVEDMGPREVTEIRSFEGSVRWWRRPAPDSRWLVGVTVRVVDDDPPRASVVALDVTDEEFVFSAIGGLGGDHSWELHVGMFDVEGELHMSVYWNGLTRLAAVDPALAVRQELLTLVYYSTASETQRVADGFWRAETSVVAGDTRWVVVEHTLEEEACAPGASTYALLPFTLDGQRLCLEELEPDALEGE